MSNNSVQTITHESGQLGMFFGGKTELEKFAEKYNNINRADFILTTAKDFLIDTPLSVPSTVIQRFKANVSAIRTLKELRGRHSVATTTEQQKLASYSGWGAVSAVFNENNAKFTNRRNEVKDLLTQAEYESARTSILSSFYTPLYLTKAIYTMLKQVGFKGGAITDPAAGVGGLISAMPKEMFNSSKITLIELDNLTAEALDHLYPSATVYNKGFETVKQQDNQDLIIQNPPFGSAKISDPLDSDLNGLTLHNYFMAKSIKSLRTGGLMVAIVSTSFLDSKNNKSRSLVGDLAELKGAIRLPKSVFLEHSGASASVDILLFQRTDKTASKLQSWIEAHETTTTTGDDFYLNNYYLDNPDAILGVMEVQKGIKGKQTHCISESKNIIGDIQKAMLNHFPTDIYKKVKKSVAISDPNTSQSDNELLTPISDTVTNDSYIVAGGYAVTDSGFIATRLIDNENGAPQYNIHQDIKGKRLERISMMVSVKQAMAELLELERTDANESDIEDARELLNDTYDAFVKRNGYFQESANRRAFSNDSFYANLSSLEVDFDAGLTREQAKRLSLKAYKPSSKKAEIFTSRVIKPWTAPTSADNSTDALWIVWNDSRVIDLPRIASMCAKSMIEVENEIVGSQVFLNPETNEYEFAETYLSGDVKHKFKLVESLLLGNPKLKVNYKKLKEILPKDIPAVDIKVELSAGWLPNKVVTEFLQYILQTTNVIAEHTLGQWHVAATSIPSLIDTKRFGLEEYPSSKVISRMMAGKDLLVYKTNPSGSRYIDKEATMQIEAITNEITTLFADWIWKDEARRESLEALYNDLYNRFVAPVYSGENLAFPDQSTQITLRPHQKTAVRRALEQGSFLMNYAVGSGKTMAFASIVHEWHRLGLKERTAVVLPNHLVESIAIEWLRLYPLENLLVLNPIDMSASKRRETLNRVKTGSKIVLIPETTFKAIPLPFETEQEIIREEISETRHAISILHKNFSIKSLEKI